MIETFRELTRQELPPETEVDYWECVGNFTDWEEWSPLACPCDTAMRNHTRSCITDDDICDWNYCDWRVGDKECVTQEPCDVAACPAPPIRRTTEKMEFEVGDDLTKEQYCALLDTIKTKYGFPPTAKIKLDVGEFNASVCDQKIKKKLKLKNIDKSSHQNSIDFKIDFGELKNLRLIE